MSQDEQQVYQVGKIGITLGGVWSTENTYEILTIVSHDGGSYIALQSVPTNTEITNTDYWQCLALKGDTGDTGETGATGASGADGADGADGKSAYDIWIDAGNEGTEADFLTSLKGADGADGQTIN